MNRVRLASLTQAAYTPRGGAYPWFVGIALFLVGFLSTPSSFAQSPAKRLTSAQTGPSGALSASGEARLPPATPATPHPDQQSGAQADAPKLVPLSLETIFRLAESQNAKIELARARVAEATAQSDLTAKNWLPNLYIGTGFYRHEGGIANEDGTLTHSSFSNLFGGLAVKSKLDLRELTYKRLVAERSVWQEKGELSRITSEALAEASTTYIDMLTARTQELIALAIQNELQGLLTRSEKLADSEPGARVVAGRVRTFVAGLKQSTVHAREEFARASAKLTYLLGLDPCATLVPVDRQLIPLELVEAQVPLCDLVAQVLANGPGMQESEQIIALAHQAIVKANGPGRYLPTVETFMTEGAFGTGPGDEMTWDNRWDLGVVVGWNLTDLFKRSERQRILDAKAAQAHFANLDLRGKLTAGVQESRESIIFGGEQIDLGRAYIAEARRTNKLATERMMQMFAQPGVHDEVLLSLQALTVSQVNFLNAVRDYDKAQLRLLVLLGIPPSLGHPAADKNCPGPVQPRQ
jgi:outer membrane protein TolC